MLFRKLITLACAALIAFAPFASARPIIRGAQSHPTPYWVLNRGTGAEPSVDCKFTTRQCWVAVVGPVNPESLIPTTRAQTVPSYATMASGLLVPFAANTPRITDLGLLVEEARTNLILQSAFASGWNENGSTLTNAIGAAPDGTLTSSSVVETTANSQHNVTQSAFTVANTTAYTASLFVLPLGAGSKRYAVVLFHSGFTGGTEAIFDSVLGTTITTGGSVTATSATKLANGWWRFSATATSNATSADIRVGLSNDGSTTSYIGDGASGLQFWGLQLEQGSFPTSYIPTTTTSVARSADSIVSAGLLNTTLLNGHSIFMQMYGVENVSAAHRLFSDNSGNGTDAFWNSSATTVRARSNGSNIADANAGSGTSAGVTKYSLQYDGSKFSAVLNKGTVGTNANAMSFAGPTVQIGNRGGLDTSLDGYIQRLAVGLFDGLYPTQ